MSERTFTEGEAYALVGDAVERETAAVKAELVTVKEQVTSISNEKDALELRATAAEEAKTKAEQELTDFKAQIETEKANEAKREQRVAKLTEVAPTLKVEGERLDRIVAMDDESFSHYVDSLKEVAVAAPEGKKDEELPRESAAFKGKEPGAGSSTTSVKGLFGARAGLKTPAA